MSDTEPAPAAPAENAASGEHAAVAQPAPSTLPPTPEPPSGIVVTVHDVPRDQPIERVVSAIDAVRRLGPGKVIVDMAGPGQVLAERLWQRGISVQPLNKIERRDLKDQQMRLLNCRALLERVERGLRQGSMGDEGFRKNLLFDIEALAERC